MQSSLVTFALWILFTPFDLIWIEQLEVGLKKGLLSSSSEANKTGKFLEFLVEDETGFPRLYSKIWLAQTQIFWTNKCCTGYQIHSPIPHNCCTTSLALIIFWFCCLQFQKFMLTGNKSCQLFHVIKSVKNNSYFVMRFKELLGCIRCQRLTCSWSRDNYFWSVLLIVVLSKSESTNDRKQQIPDWQSKILSLKRCLFLWWTDGRNQGWKIAIWGGGLGKFKGASIHPHCYLHYLKDAFLQVIFSRVSVESSNLMN